MKWMLPMVFVAVVLSGCVPGGGSSQGQPPVVDTNGVATNLASLPAGLPAKLNKPVEQMNSSEVKEGNAFVSDQRTKLDQFEERLNARAKQLLYEKITFWLRISSVALFVLAVVLVVLAVKFGWALGTFGKIAAALAALSSICLLTSFIVHYLLAIALVVVAIAAAYLVVLFWHNGWKAQQALAQVKNDLASAEDGVKVLATAAAGKIDTTAALADAEIHNNSSLQALLAKVGAAPKK